MFKDTLNPLSSKSSSGLSFPPLRSLTGSPLLAFLLCVFFLILFLAPWLPQPNRVPFGIEGIGQQTVWQSSAARLMGSCPWDFFEPGILAGYPLLAESEAFLLYPLKAAFFFLPAHQALSVTWLLHFLLLCGGTFLLVYTWTRNQIAALVSALLAVFSGPILGTAVGGHLSQFAAFSWLPWLAWSWHEAFRKNRLSFAALTALFALMSLAAGHIQFCLMVTVSGFLLALAAATGSRNPFRARWPVIAFAVLSTAFAFLAGGLWIKPLMELVSFSNRAGCFSAELLELGSLHLHQLGTAVVPDLYGNTASSPYLGLLTYVETTCYFGVFSLLLALTGFSWRDPLQRSAWLLALLGFMLASSPVSVQLARYVEPMARFQLPVRWRLISFFALALLAGLGAARILSGETRGRRVAVAGAVLLLLVVCFWGHLFLLGGLESLAAASSAEIGPGIRKALLLNRSLLEPAALLQFRTDTSRVLARAMWLVPLATLFLYLLTRLKRRTIYLPALICVPVVLSLYLFARPLVQNVPWSRCGWPKPLTEFLQTLPGPFRVQPEIPFRHASNPFPDAYRQGFQNFYRFDMSTQDWGGLAGLEATTGGFSMLTQSYQNLTRLAGTPYEMPGTVARRRLNVRYLIAPTDAPPEGVDPKPLCTDGSFAVFEDRQAVPRVAFFTDWTIDDHADASRRANTDSSISPLPPTGSDSPQTARSRRSRREQFDRSLHSSAEAIQPEASGTLQLRPLYNSAPIPLPLPPTGSDPKLSRVVPSYERLGGPTFLSKLTADNPGVVVFSELYYPGFEARVDGEPAEICLAWDSLMAVHVPAGAHEVGIRYNPRIWVQGTRWTIFGVLGLLLLGWLGRRRDQRRGRG